jgi:hypothetical protein
LISGQLDFGWPRTSNKYLLSLQLLHFQVMDFDYDDDDFVLPPRLQDSLLSRPSNSLPLNDAAGGGGPTSPIQIDEEVVIQKKRKPQVKLIDR